jgi:hypothetical protein
MRIVQEATQQQEGGASPLKPIQTAINGVPFGRPTGADPNEI